VVQEDLLELLGKAVTCAVLGKAGPQRSRVLGLLHKDERVLSLEQVPPEGSALWTVSRPLTLCNPMSFPSTPPAAGQDVRVARGRAAQDVSGAGAVVVVVMMMIDRR
jgi:hypothetical protein